MIKSIHFQQSSMDVIVNYIKQFLLFTALYTCSITGKAQTGTEINRLSQRLSVSKADTGRVELLLDLSRNYIEKFGDWESDLDTASGYKNEAAALSKKLGYTLGIGKCMVLEAMIDAGKKDTETAYRLLNDALLFFEKNNFVRQQAKVYLTLASITDIEGTEVYKKIRYLEKALVLYRQVNSKENTGIVLQELGNIKMMQGKYDSSLLLLDQALRHYQSAGYKALQGLYAVYSRIYHAKGESLPALKYGLLAVKTAENLGDQSEQLCSIYSEVGMIYTEIDKDALAISWLEKSRALAISLKDTTHICQASMNIGSILLSTGRAKEAIALMSETEKRFPPRHLSFKVAITALFIQAYIEDKQLKKAAAYFEKMKFYYRSLNKASPVMNYVYLGIIPYLQATKEYEQTYEYVEGFNNMAIQTGNLEYRAQAELFYFDADSATGKYLSAIQHYQKYKTYIDSVTSTEKARQLSSLQLQFETEQKDKDIQSLTQKSNLKDAIIQKDRNTRKLIIAGTTLLLLLLALSYNRYRLKQRSNIKLQAQQGEINRQNELLKKLLTEKEWLLREIHHRVKNNLQIVISLLNTQSAYLDNKDALLAIKNSQHRMHAMSLIHQRLYQSDNLSCIDMYWYIQELIAYMRESFDTDNRIHFLVNAEKLELDVVEAVPLGLILNEAISNAIKYAFPDNKQGEVYISLTKKGRECHLVIKDNGIGLPPGFDKDNSDSLGMSLLYGLSEQLGGTLELHNHNGLILEVRFRINREEACTDKIIA